MGYYSESFRFCPQTIPSQKKYVDNEKKLQSEMALDENHTANNVYHDHSQDTEEDVERDLMIQLSKNIKSCDPKRHNVKRRVRGGVSDPFPFKLHEMLDYVENEGDTHVVSWLPHGRAFCVHKPNNFVSCIMSKHFRQTKLTSFQRQLNLYGFCRLTEGADSGAYYHELFLKGMKHLSELMTRTKIKGTGSKSPSKSRKKLNFYEMIPIAPRQDKLCCSASTLKSPAIMSSSISDLSGDDFIEKEGDLVSFEGKPFHYLDITTPFQVSSTSSDKLSDEIPWLEELDDEFKISDDFNFDSCLDQLVDTL